MNRNPRACLAAFALCSGISLAHPIHPALTGSEKKLVCGETGNGVATEGWKQIPANQAIFELRGFLQSRGYLDPHFTKSETGGIELDPGAITRVKAVRLEGDSQGIAISRKRHVIGERLTSKLLDSIENWVKHELSTQGYPCAEVKATGSAKGTVRVGIQRGELSIVRNVQSSGLSDTDPGVLRRFDAFSMGEPYDADLLAVSADRAVKEGMVERSFFFPACPQGSPTQQSVEGSPRLLTLGGSLNTEEVGVVQASLARVRIGKNASSAGMSALASFKRQDLSAFYDWHFVSPESRDSFRPELEAKHENEDPYETYFERGELAYATSWEALGAGMKLAVGPQFEYFEERRGGGASRPYASMLAADFDSIGHQYEFNQDKLGGGFRMKVNLESGTRSVLSNFGATRVRAKIEHAWNVGSYDPPALLLTLRGGYALTWVQGGVAEAGLLPPNWFQYLGGASDVRGFGRLELGGSYPDESLSSAFGTFEISPDLLPDFLGRPLRPFGFVDAGLLSYQNYNVQSPIFWSPGIGLTWSSPIGSFRSTVARGLISGTPRELAQQGLASSHWQVFVSLGQPL